MRATSSIDFCNTITIRGHPLRLNWFLATCSDRLETWCYGFSKCYFRKFRNDERLPRHERVMNRLMFTSCSCGCRPRFTESRIDSLVSPLGKRAPARRASSTSLSPVRACVVLENPSPPTPSYRVWESRTGQDSSADVLPRRANALRRIEVLSIVKASFTTQRSLVTPE